MYTTQAHLLHSVISNCDSIIDTIWLGNESAGLRMASVLQGKLFEEGTMAKLFSVSSTKHAPYSGVFACE